MAQNGADLVDLAKAEAQDEGREEVADGDGC